MHKIQRRHKCVQPVPAKLNAVPELHLLRAAVATLQEAGLMDHDVLEQAKQGWHRRTKSPRE